MPSTGDNDDILRKVKDQVQVILAPPGQDLSTPPDPESLNQQIVVSETVLHDVMAIGSVEGLPEPTREESVEEARKILRWLRNMEFADKDVEQWLDGSSAKVMLAKKEALQKLVRILAIQIHHAKLRNARMQDDPAIENAADAISAMAVSIAEHTFNLLPDYHARLEELEELIDAMPERALMRQSQSLSQLLDTAELGLAQATGQVVSELPAADRLQIASNQIEKSAYQLQSVDTLDKPTREESIDLARDILRKLQNLSFGAQSVQEFIDTGTAENKAAFAQQVAELVDIYRNLMAEAVSTNPDILQDKNVQAANDAVGQFAHSVKLMAAKEIPSSAAATQQISADVARMPEKWGEMHDRTVDRLTKSAEGGVEKAIEELAEQQEQQQEEDLAQDMIENALIHSDSTKRRKKKRRGETKSRSGKGGKKQLKKHMDMTADDYVLKQGRFTIDAQTARATPEISMPGVRAEDMETIRKLGGSLRDIGNQLKDLTTTVSSVSINDKIMPSPDEQSVASRILDTKPQKPTTPRGNIRPRN